MIFDRIADSPVERCAQLPPVTRRTRKVRLFAWIGAALPRMLVTVQASADEVGSGVEVHQLELMVVLAELAKKLVSNGGEVTSLKSTNDCASSRDGRRQSLRPQSPAALTAATYFSVSQLPALKQVPLLAVPGLPPSLLPVELNQV